VRLQATATVRVPELIALIGTSYCMRAVSSANSKGKVVTRAMVIKLSVLFDIKR
jgi:hypothetical protein